MYGKGAGTLTAATGISLLPETGNNRPLFILAVSLLAVGTAVFVASIIMGRKSRQSEAN